MIDKEWIKEVDDELKVIFGSCNCHKCGKEIRQPSLSLLEHGYKHIHHFCSFPCLAEWSSSYKYK